MDAITLAAVVRELEETLVGGRVQAVVQPDEWSLALEVYAHGERHWLLASSYPVHPRVHLITEKARRGLETDTPFLLLARKHLRGSTLIDIQQPSWERVVRLRFRHADEGETSLVAEIMGRWSNLLLLSPDGDILDALRRFGPAEHSRRAILPGQPYIAPPAQHDKQPIDLVQPADLDLLARDADGPLWRALVEAIAGLSPLAAREIVFRATGDAHADFTHPNARPAALFDALDWLRRLSRQGGWAPSLARATADGPPIAFAPYELSHLDHYESVPTISAAARTFYATALGGDSYAGRRTQVQTLLDDARKRLEGRRASLGEQAVGEEDIERLRSTGEWILAYAWQIRPGDTELIADTGVGELRIGLDPTLTPAENAQAVFERYHKAKRAAERVPALLAEVDRDLAYLDQLQADLDLADNAPQIEELRDLLMASGLLPAAPGKPRPPVQRSQPLRYAIDGFTVIIGRNALQNETVTWKLAAPDDLWLHSERTPGAHVVIKTGGRDVPAVVVAQAAAWAAFHSQARQDAKVSVIVAERRHLRRIPGGRPGQVRVLQARSIVVSPAPPPQT